MVVVTFFMVVGSLFATFAKALDVLLATGFTPTDSP
jgi:hypothetical protein